jgi:hypothetical protein
MVIFKDVRYTVRHSSERDPVGAPLLEQGFLVTVLIHKVFW